MIIMDEIQIIKKILNVAQMNKGNVSHLKNSKLCLENYFTLKMSLFFVL